MAPNSCNICNQTFNSERELQEHQSTSHSQDGRSQRSRLATGAVKETTRGRSLLRRAFFGRSLCIVSSIPFNHANSLNR
jgi:hypothetical protein